MPIEYTWIKSIFLQPGDKVRFSGQDYVVKDAEPQAEQLLITTTGGTRFMVERWQEIQLKSVDGNEPWVPLEDLRCGAIFVTRDGIYAVKSEYHNSNDNPQWQCILLASWEYAWFTEGNRTMVREVFRVPQPGL